MARRPARPASLLALAAAVAAGALGPPRALAAQDYPRLVVEGRGGLALPLPSFRASTGDLRVDRAPSFGLHFVYRGLNGWGADVGFSQHRFDCSPGGCPGDEYVLTTWDLGWQRTLGSSGAIWLRGNFLFGRVERGFQCCEEVDRAQVSRLSAGAEAAAGVRIPIRGRLALTPGGRLGWLNAQFPKGPLLRLRWAVADLGVALGF